MHRPSGTAVAAIGVAAAVLSGCGLTLPPSTTEPSAPPPGSTSAAATPLAPGTTAPSSGSETQPGSTPTAGATNPTPAPTPAATGDSPVAERAGSVEGQRTTLAVYPIARSGSLVDVRMTLTVDPAGSAVFLGQSFGDSPTRSVQKSDDVAGVKLVDGRNRKVHLVARGTDRVCVCSNVRGLRAEPGVPIELAATFGAPPVDVTSLDVLVPNFGTLRDVPVV